MIKNLILSLFISLFFAAAVQAEPSLELVKAFISASEKARQPDMKKQDLDNYLAFMSEDIIDHHAAFGVSFTGKKPMREGIIEMGASMVSVAERVDNVILGTNTAVVVVNEDSKYYKKGKLKHFNGRTILVLEFDAQGLIKQMRRYLD